MILRRSWPRVGVGRGVGILAGVLGMALPLALQAEGYVDLHTHLACFAAPPGAGAPSPPCYIGAELLESPKLGFYPKYFGMRKGEHYVLPEGSRMPRFQETWINAQPVLDATGAPRPRRADQRYDASNRHLFAFEHLSELLQRNERVEAAVVLAMDEVWDIRDEGGELRGVPVPAVTQFHVSNQVVIEGIRWVEERLGKRNLLFGASVHPYRYPPDRIGPALAALKDQGAVLVKLIAPTHRFHAASACPDAAGENRCRSPGDSPAVAAEKARRLAAFYAALAALDLPLLVHIDEEGSFGGDPEEDFTGATKVLQPLRAGVRVVVAHAASKGGGPLHAPELGGEDPGAEVDHYEQLKLVIDHLRSGPEAALADRLFVDISVLPNILHAPLCVGPRKDDLYRITQEDHGAYWAGRLLFGTDYPLNHALFRPKYCFTSRVVPGNGKYRELFERTGHLDTRETNRAYQEGRHFDHAVLMQEAFGVGEEVFWATRGFVCAGGLDHPVCAPEARRSPPG